MNEQEKKSYLERYHEAKEHGVPFFPDIVFKDAVISLIVFLVLIALAYFRGAPLEARANPADTSYTPRPEWYFLFLFQLFKYFPGKIEVIGVVILPTLAILLLFALPFLDLSALRSPLKRPAVIAVTALVAIGIIGLTGLAMRATPPLTEATKGDKVAELYARNCAPCHGSTISVQAGTNLHAVIAQGKHEGMPAWSSDLTTDEIDALAGFIVSPAGSQVFTQNCSSCHDIAELVASDPLQLKNALDQGPAFTPHSGQTIPVWSDVISPEQRTALLNFLVAPDGQRLFAVNCSPCHGQAVAYTGDEAGLRAIIQQGGQHLEMPPWQEKLNQAQIDRLASYVVNPASDPTAQKEFQQNCTPCHGERVPKANNVEEARKIITSGGPHETMPVWGNVLTEAQLDALVAYTLSASQGTSLEVGQNLYSQNCSGCHGEFGEGGPNPTRQGDIIAPISTAEFLKTRDDSTLRSIISQGQPNFGMSPFGSANGGPLDGDQIDAIVAFLRSWQAKPPVELPPDIPVDSVSLNAEKIYAAVCAQCHGQNGEGGVGPSFQSASFQSGKTDQELFDSISQGHKATSMIAWGEILTSEQINQLVSYIRELGKNAPPEAQAGPPSFKKDILPIFTPKCVPCHGSMGGWNASTYSGVMTSGDHAPVVIAGDAEKSLLVQKLQGTQTEGALMPPGGKLPSSEIQIILDWIKAGAPDN